jgi:tRNA modification GTPase
MAAARNLEEETIVALATPVGNAALAVVRVSGPLAAVLAAEGPLGARRLSPRRVEHRDYHALDGRLVDDVVAVHFPAPRSYTGEDVLEISTHGNPFLVQRVIDDLCARGCRPARPGEFTQRAFLSGRMDLSQAEAVMDVIRARSDRSLELAQRQLRGEMGRRLAPLEEGLLQALAEVEAYIDFPEEDIDPETGAALCARMGEVLGLVRVLEASAYRGRILREGVRVVLCGSPNAGKSSLLNHLLGRDRAIVSPVAGTTRDTIEESVQMRGYAVRLIDTAGIREAGDSVEAEGVVRSQREVDLADIILAVVDGSAGSDLAYFPADKRVLRVFNKSDLPEHGDWKGVEGVRVSCLTGSGLDRLEAAVEARIAEGGQLSDTDEPAVNARQADALRRCATALEAALRGMEFGAGTELVAEDLREALGALGEIVGRVDADDILGRIFASFCIGK